VATGTNRVVEQQTIGRATRCIVNDDVGPPSFLVADIGKAGVARLKPRQAAMARSIAHDIHSRTLRFLVFKNGEFIVFDAETGPCEPDAPGYPVLNESCNAAYSPTDNFDHAGAYSSCYPSPRPWLTGPHRDTLVAQSEETYQPILPDGTFGARVGAGIECVPFGQRKVEPPESYAVADIGRPGVPRLSPKQMRLVRDIRRYVKSPHLRFVWYSDAYFMVYDAVAGACVDTAPGYLVLNGSCYEYYEPGEDPRFTTNVPTCNEVAERRPWMKSVTPH
jgi:hypothetical protein